MSTMKKVTLFVLGIAAVLALLYVVLLNTATVEFHITRSQSVSLLLGVLLIGVFLAGILATGLVVGLLQAGRSLRSWPERRQERRATKVADWERAGNTLVWEGDLSRARSLLQKAWRKQPDNGRIPLALSSSYLDTAEYGAARRILREAASHNAADAELRFALSEAEQQNGDLAEAIRMLETVRVQHPRAPRVLRRLRTLYLKRGRWQEAAEAQDAYLRCLPSGDSTQAERALLTHLRYQAALSIESAAGRAEALEAIVHADRTFLPAAVSLGDALVAAERVQEAISCWERAFRSVPRMVLIERILAQQSTPKDRQRTLGLAKKQLQQAAPDTVHLLAARLAIENGDLTDAATELEAVTQQEEVPVQRLWARLHRERNQTDQALAAFARATNRMTGQASGYRCTNCGRATEEWEGYCTGCGEWDTYRSVLEIMEQPAV